MKFLGADKGYGTSCCQCGPHTKIWGRFSCWEYKKIFYLGGHGWYDDYYYYYYVVVVVVVIFKDQTNPDIFLDEVEDSYKVFRKFIHYSTRKERKYEKYIYF